MKEHTYPIMFRVEQSHWWYTGRRPRILDVGCGTGANLLMLSKYGEAEGVDISEDALSFCRERGLDKVRLGAGEQLPYEDATFDLVTALDVVEHMDDDLAGLREMRRVLRPGGRALLFVPTLMFAGTATRARAGRLRDRTHDLRKHHLFPADIDRKSTRLNSSHVALSRM